MKARLLHKFRLSDYSWGDLLAIAIPALLLIMAGFYLAAQYIRPAPPRQLILATGSAGGAYEAFGLRYKDFLARYDIEVVLQPSAGALDNLNRLRQHQVDAAFIQSGITALSEEEGIRTLGNLYYEPLWIFYRPAAFAHPPAHLTELRGKRIAIGAEGSGTRQLSQALLNASGVNSDNTRLLPAGGLDAAMRIHMGQLDVVMVVGTPTSAVVWQLLYTSGVELMSLREAEAYSRHFPYVSRQVLPEGSIDFVSHLPASDVVMLAPTATLAINDDLHPALVDLLLWAAGEVHGGAGILQRPHEFPNTQHNDFPIAPEAERYFKNGKPFLQRYLPFWAAILIDRLVVMLIPLLALLVPIFKFAPGLYSWRIRSRINKRYGELKLLEAEIAHDSGKHRQAEWLARLLELERDVNRLPTPLPYAYQVYTLRSHIQMVRNTILDQTQT